MELLLGIAASTPDLAYGKKKTQKKERIRHRELETATESETDRRVDRQGDSWMEVRKVDGLMDGWIDT